MLQNELGVYFMELAQNMRAIARGDEKYRMRLYVGHDGSMIRLVSGLGIGRQRGLMWPALGSEVVIEVCCASQCVRLERLFD